MSEVSDPKGGIIQKSQSPDVVLDQDAPSAEVSAKKQSLSDIFTIVGFLSIP